MLRRSNFLANVFLIAFGTASLWGCGGAEFELDDSGGLFEGGTGESGAGGDSAILDAEGDRDVSIDGRGVDGLGGSDTTIEASDSLTADRMIDGNVDDRNMDIDSRLSGDSPETGLSDVLRDGDSSAPGDGQLDTKSDPTADTTTDNGIIDVGCSEPSTYYRDKDGDGVGDSADQQTGCRPPSSSKWVLIGGDCRDDMADVKPIIPGDPNPPVFSGSGYADTTKPQGISFDYDCSGTEEADPSNTYGIEPDCSLIGCAGVGYVAVNPTRTGTGINGYCGSVSVKRCKGLAVCSTTLEDATPFRCR
jgi:hypothetical protein